jgi:nucleoside-diphosphate-sugar epimerase
MKSRAFISFRYSLLAFLFLDRLFFGDSPVKELSDQIKVIKDDIRYFDTSILDGVDAVFDLAAISNDPAGELGPQKTLDINFRGRARVAQAAKKHGVSRYILASSCSIYGFRDGVLNETSPINPLTTYAKANLTHSGFSNNIELLTICDPPEVSSDRNA